MTIITTEPNAVMKPIHDRMPVILESSDERAWLEDDDPDELKSLLDPYADDQMNAFEEFWFTLVRLPPEPE